MLKHLAVLFMCLLPGLAWSEQDSVFDTYADYEAFVDHHVMTRDFMPLVLRLGGKDEYTSAELEAVNAQLMNAMRLDFTDVAVIKKVDLGNGFRQEARVYWNARKGYTYFYAFLHDRGDSIVVLRFDLNTSSTAIFAKF